MDKKLEKVDEKLEKYAEKHECVHEKLEQKIDNINEKITDHHLSIEKMLMGFKLQGRVMWLVLATIVTGVVGYGVAEIMKKIGG